jgi:hypothetical protein
MLVFSPILKEFANPTPLFALISLAAKRNRGAIKRLSINSISCVLRPTRQAHSTARRGPSGS